MADTATAAGAAQQRSLRELGAEVSILSRVHHPHVLLLLGCCLEPGCGALVYKLMEGGSLEDALMGQAGGQDLGQARAALAWQDRVRVAAEVAAALAFLHSAPEPIIHMDLKPANILLSWWASSQAGPLSLGCCSDSGRH